MYKVTEKRLEIARPILDEYVRKLDEEGRFLAPRFERDLREVWRTGYQEIKSAMVDLYKKHGGKYGQVAEYYMRHQAPQGMMVSEFKHALGILDRDIPIILVTLLGGVRVTALEAHSVEQAEASGLAAGIDAIVLVLGPDKFLDRLKPRRTSVLSN